MEKILQLVGAGHVALVLGSLVIPKLLDWTEHFEKLPKLIRQIFWTYAGYILGMNLFIGLLCLFASQEMVQYSNLTLLLSGFMFFYWFARCLIQFFYFSRADLPKKWYFTYGEGALWICFLSFTSVFGYLFYLQLIH